MGEDFTQEKLAVIQTIVKAQNCRKKLHWHNW